MSQSVKCDLIFYVDEMYQTFQCEANLVYQGFEQKSRNCRDLPLRFFFTIWRRDDQVISNLIGVVLIRVWIMREYKDKVDIGISLFGVSNVLIYDLLIMNVLHNWNNHK